jgi:pheromone shutdown-related protein TraB
MTIPAIDARDYGPDVHTINLEDKEILLIGTAHISQGSVDLVTRVIEAEHPDRVCLELDDKRYHAMSRKDSWESLDLKQIIRNKQLSTLLVSLLMGSYQKKLGGQLGVTPGAELLAAARTADRLSIPVSLCDRDVRITLRRAWKSTSLLRKGYLLTSLIASLFDSEELDEDRLEGMKKKDVLASLMAEMDESFPELKRVLIDERDIYLAEKIRAAPGTRQVAVVGAGHVEGIKKAITGDHHHKLPEITTIPPVSRGWKIAGWSIPVLILASLAAIGVIKGASVAGANLMFWILANGIPAAIGALLALAHPVTTIGAFTAAPITSLTPVIGAGYVTAFIQVMTRPPVVREFETVGDDISSLAGWWKNKLLRVFLVFFFTGLGSAVGTWVGGYEIFKNLLT